MATAAYIDDLKDHLDRWAAAQLSCKPADRRAAEDGVRLAYAGAGLTPPEKIVWTGGPIEIASQLALATADDVIGANVKSEIYDRVQDTVGTLAEIFWKEVVVAQSDAARLGNSEDVAHDLDRARKLSAAVSRVVCEAADCTLFTMRTQLRHVMLRLRGRPWLLPPSGFDGIAIGPKQFASLGVYDYLHDVGPSKDLTRSMQGLCSLAKSAGWIVPHEHVCWISDRPNRLETDVKGRLHRADGPALSYRDGWSAYAWKGVPVPAWMIEHPEQITLSTIADTFDPVLRNCMIDIMTPECFVKTGAPAPVSADESGVLWRKLWGYRGTTTGSWTAVEVVNGTPEVDGTHKHYFLRVPSRMRTAREAVAWTYGMTADEYADLDIRT